MGRMMFFAVALMVANFADRFDLHHPISGYRMHTSLLRKLPETDSLVGVGFTEGGVMLVEIGLGRFGDRRLEKGGPFYTRRWFDGLVRASDASQGTEHGRFGSRVFCATTG
jgi:hypothetical protein